MKDLLCTWLAFAIFIRVFEGEIVIIFGLLKNGLSRVYQLKFANTMGAFGKHFTRLLVGKTTGTYLATYYSYKQAILIYGQFFLN